jgi:hypothetical protein
MEAATVRERVATEYELPPNKLRFTLLSLTPY